jgi:hypothetical protein
MIANPRRGIRCLFSRQAKRDAVGQGNRQLQSQKASQFLPTANCYFWAALLDDV